MTSLGIRHKSSSRPPPAPHSPSSTYKSKGRRRGYFPSVGHQCDHFAFPPPPPADRRRTGPRRKFCFFPQLGLVFNSLLTNIISILNLCNSICINIQTQCVLSYCHCRILLIRFFLFPFQHVLCVIFLWSKL